MVEYGFKGFLNSMKKAPELIILTYLKLLFFDKIKNYL